MDKKFVHNRRRRPQGQQYKPQGDPAALADALERLARSGAEVLRTDACGDITLTLRGGQLCITPYKARWAP